MSPRCRPAVLLLCLCLLPALAQASGYRVSGSTGWRMLELQPLQLVEIPASEVPGSGNIRQLPDGRWVVCDPTDGTCRAYEPGPVRDTSWFEQDLRGAAWGDNGLWAMAHARMRRHGGGSAELWPRLDDELDLLELAIEWRQPRFRARAGRQWTGGALGMNSFDGLSLRVQDGRRAGLELYGGIQHLRGLVEPHDGDALAAADLFAPLQHGWLGGGRLHGAIGEWVQGAVAYRRVLRDDRDVLYQDRGAADLRLRAGTHHLDLRAERDFATAQWNELGASLAANWRGSVTTEFSWREHRPFFETWTIWNAFSPVAWTEFGGRVALAPRGRAYSAGVELHRREYDDVSAGTLRPALLDDGWSLSTNLFWAPHPRWTLLGRSTARVGPGEAGNDLSGGVDHRLPLGLRVGLRALWFDYAREYRVSGGSAAGGSLELGWEPRAGQRLQLRWTHIEHRPDDTPAAWNWGQDRLALRWDWALGGAGGTR